MEDRGGHTTYPECKAFPRAQIKDTAEGIHPYSYLARKRLSSQGRGAYKELRNRPVRPVQAYAMSHSKSILPLYESMMSDYKRMKLSSVETNELLKCRWKSYINSAEKKTFGPFQFPGVDDLHFHNCEVKFMPSLSPKNWPLRMKMGVGPGVDHYGQMPIPNDMHVCKSDNTKIIAHRAKKH